MAKKSTGPWWYAQKGSYYLWHNGKRVSLKTDDETEAVRAWHRLMGGGIPDPPQSTKTVSAPPPVPATGPTVADVVAEYLEAAERRVSAAAYVGYAKYLTRFSASLGKRGVASLTPENVEHFLSKQTTWGATYRAGCHGTLSQMLGWAVEVGYTPRNVMKQVRKPRRQSRGVEAVLTAEEHQRLLAVAPPDTRDLLILLWCTGARPGEIASLTAEMVRQSRDGVIPLSAHKSAHKGKHRQLLLSGEAWAIVQRRAGKAEGLLFRGRKGLLSAAAIGSRLRDLCKVAGIRHLVPYGYRHTFATDALAAGVPDATVASLLGHADTSMVHRHYSHLSSRTQTLRDAAAKIH